MALILHPEPGPRPGDLERWVGAARVDQAERHRAGFSAAGVADAEIVAGPPDGIPFGARLRSFVERHRPGGIVVLGSGAVPLAGLADRARFAQAAGRPDRVALANNRYSADVVAVSCASALLDLPDLASDNALPRWLEETAGYRVDDLRRSWHLGVDIDGPMDLLLLGRTRSAIAGIDTSRAVERLAAVRLAAADRRAEVVVAGRTSADALSWLERRTAARTRAIVEERGLRTGRPDQRPPRSLLGTLLDRDGPGSLGTLLASLGEAALVDTRVLLGHRLGADETAWPGAEDRYASDLLLHERIADPWLRELTRAAAEAPVPIVLGGHTLVGPGLRLVLQPRAAGGGASRPVAR